jgi:hypothetical protein
MDAPEETGVDGEVLAETPANRLFARLDLLVSTLGKSDSRGFGGAIRSKAGAVLALTKLLA